MVQQTPPPTDDTKILFRITPLPPIENSLLEIPYRKFSMGNFLKGITYRKFSTFSCLIKTPPGIRQAGAWC